MKTKKTGQKSISGKAILAVGAVTALAYGGYHLSKTPPTVTPDTVAIKAENVVTDDVTHTHAVSDTTTVLTEDGRRMFNSYYDIVSSRLIELQTDKSYTGGDSLAVSVELNVVEFVIASYTFKGYTDTDVKSKLHRLNDLRKSAWDALDHYRNVGIFEGENCTPQSKNESFAFNDGIDVNIKALLEPDLTGLAKQQGSDNYLKTVTAYDDLIHSCNSPYNVKHIGDAIKSYAEVLNSSEGGPFYYEMSKTR